MGLWTFAEIKTRRIQSTNPISCDWEITEGNKHLAYKLQNTHAHKNFKFFCPSIPLSVQVNMKSSPYPTLYMIHQ